MTRAIAHAPQGIEPSRDLRLSPEKDSGVLLFERFETAIRRPARVIGWRPGKVLWVQAGAAQANAEAVETIFSLFRC